MSKLTKTAAIAIAAATMAAATPASATIFEYSFSNGDLLTIDTDTASGTWVGDNIDVTFSGDELANFQGGDNPNFTITLADVTGTRTINGTDFAATNRSGNRSHPFQLKSESGGRINLWSWWGDPVVAGDYVRSVDSFREVDVPAPGVLGLFGLALVALGLGGRRRRQTGAAAA